MSGKPFRRIFLFGDRVKDEYILPLSRRGGYGDKSGLNEDWENHEQWVRMSRNGGVAMTHDMLRWHFQNTEIVVAKPTTNVPALTSLARLGNCDCCATTGRAISFQKTDSTSKHRVEDLKLRVEHFEGYFRNDRDQGEAQADFRLPEAEEEADAIVINDAGTDLRRSNTDTKDDFHKVMKGLEGKRTDVLLKMHLPLAQGRAWQLFKEARSNARSSIVIVSADDLRLGSANEPSLRGTPIARCPSWDRVAEDLHAAIGHERGSLLSELMAHSDALIVMFDVEGAAVLQGTTTAPKISLIFDPMRAEGEMAHILPGDMVGKMNCFLARFASEFVGRNKKKGKKSNPVTCAKDALLDARLYAESHFSVRRIEKNNFELCPDYPRIDVLRENYAKRSNAGHDKPQYIVLSPKMKAKKAQLLADSVGASRGRKSDQDRKFFELAEQVVYKGIERTLSVQPHGRFGKLWTVDREEIEGLRAVDTLIRKYLDNPSDAKPLSIAIFGPPGAGKSFGVRQLVDEDVTPVLEFNLSQVEESQLPGFFHMIRDCNLEQKTPLCFFDEFDSKNLSLLKNFLAPMQDGKFLEGQTQRPIGRGIFVFAGGTSETFKSFRTNIEEMPAQKQNAGREKTPEEKEQEEDRKHAKSVKKADFVSRLRGSYDVKGPNRHTESSNGDPAHYLRRAILLRRFFEDQLSGIISQEDKYASIEPALLNALLRVEKYRHGTRSMELLVQALAREHAGASVGRSDLPIDGQIEMLVDLPSWKECLG